VSYHKIPNCDKFHINFMYNNFLYQSTHELVLCLYNPFRALNCTVVIKLFQGTGFCWQNVVCLLSKCARTESIYSINHRKDVEITGLQVKLLHMTKNNSHC